ncbi:MAG: trehalose-phosphatase [Candidatus Rokubacteria bacterium]|nr:trehalose-phosphatase [Candidatus Rokubacteria bacterium]
MSSDLRHLIPFVGDWVGHGGNLLLMTHYDGTLTPIVDDPADAGLTESVRADLRALATAPRSRVAVISGRDLADLRARVAVPGLIYVGCHGLEVDGGGFRFTHPAAHAEQDNISALSLALCHAAPFVEGLRVEPKRLGVAVHYRRVADSALPEVESMLTRSLRCRRSPFTVLHGRKVVEILPKVGWTKGHCAVWIVDRIVDDLPPPVLAIYIGDSRTDEHTFAALRGRALTIGVGDAVPPYQAAAYRLSDVGEVQRLVAAIASTGAAARSVW